MKNIVNFIIVTLFLISFVAADVSGGTVITGTIYNSDYSSVVAGAEVKVDCAGFEQVVFSDVKGGYGVVYDSDACSAGDSLNVYASSNGKMGSAIGVIDEDELMENWDLGVVNVSIVPEFGFFMGMLTMISAVGVFFVVRRDNE